MKITEIRTDVRKFRFEEPMKVAFATITDMDVCIVKIVSVFTVMRFRNMIVVDMIVVIIRSGDISVPKSKPQIDLCAGKVFHMILNILFKQFSDF